MASPATRVETIEGRKTLVQQTASPLPQKLDGLFAEMFSLLVKVDITITGASAQCERLREHRFTTIREGRHFGRDRVLRDLRVQMCADCGAVCVRDISYDRISLYSERSRKLEEVPAARRGPVRRDLILGWYSGARPNNRQYR